MEDDGSTTTFFLYRGDQGGTVPRIVPPPKRRSDLTNRFRAVWKIGDGMGGVAPALAPVAATYVYGNGIDEVLNMRRVPAGGGLAENFFYHADDQGTIWALTDAAGAVVERYDYEDYGETHVLDPTGDSRAESAIGNPYRYTARRADTESDLYWYRTRYYDPVAGRFVSRDSIGVWGDPLSLGNGFTYVANSPIVYSDPLGESVRRCSNYEFGWTISQCNVKGKRCVIGTCYVVRWGLFPIYYSDTVVAECEEREYPIVEITKCKVELEKNKNQCASLYPRDSEQRRSCYRLAEAVYRQCELDALNPPLCPAGN